MEFDHFVTQGTMSMDQALNGMVPGVMVRGYGVQKAGLNDGQYDDTGAFREVRRKQKYVPALAGSVAEDAVFESELVSVEAGKPDGASGRRNPSRSSRRPAYEPCGNSLLLPATSYQ